WPIVVLAGMRRFYARHEWPVPPIIDWTLLGLAYVAWLAAWVDSGSAALLVVVFAGGAGVLHLYAAMLLLRLPEFRRSSALKALAVTEIAAAVIQALQILQAQSGGAASITEHHLL